jgi:hypothetical protein
LKNGNDEYRAQREERLRKKATELGEDPDKFVTITEEDKHDSLTYRNSRKSDARLCEWAKENEEDPHEYVEIIVQERLIGEEIIHREFKEEGVTSSWLDIEE